MFVESLIGLVLLDREVLSPYLYIYDRDTPKVPATDNYWSASV